MAIDAPDRTPSTGEGVPAEDTPAPVSFSTTPAEYRHWHLTLEGGVARLAMDVDEQAGIHPGYTLKLNSYDLGVDIELHDAVQRLRFEHPEVGAVVLTSDKARCFCAGANIAMLAQASHPWKVNFCKFTNETRLEMEDATASSGQTYIAAINGTAAGGGYELALACAEILLVDDGSTAIALPELPLLAVLPATGGLTRVVDKRHVRRDLADLFATRAEGVKAATAMRWGLVDAAIPRGQFEQRVQARAREIAEGRSRDGADRGVPLEPLERALHAGHIEYRYVRASIDRAAGVVSVEVRGPDDAPPASLEAAHAAGSRYWPLALGRELDDLILHLRFNEPELGTWVIRTRGDLQRVVAHDRFLIEGQSSSWFLREVGLLWRRVLKRLDVTSRSLFAVVEPGSCFAGLLLELALACDRQYMLEGSLVETEPPAALVVTAANDGLFPMGNGLSRLATRFVGNPDRVRALLDRQGDELDAPTALACGLVTAAPDDIDWEDELRIALEERSSFSPDALTGMEASYRFAGPETMETKIFGRLTAWQNWIFSRPNAAGPDGALRLYGTGRRPMFDRRRV